jgi:hypothetical protein
MIATSKHACKINDVVLNLKNCMKFMGHLMKELESDYVNSILAVIQIIID